MQHTGDFDAIIIGAGIAGASLAYFLSRSAKVLVLEREARAGRLALDLDQQAAADFLARMILSLISAQGRWDLTDREQVQRLVRDELLGGILV